MAAAGTSSRLFLHVGAPKTGTTYLQYLMWRNRAELRRRGVNYPGARPEDHFLAAMDLAGATVDEVGDPRLPRAWPRLVKRVRDTPGTVVVSHELFAPMEPERIERALGALAPGRELHIVCTARDLGRQLPAVWQEDLKNRHTLGFGEFLDAVRDPEHGHWLGGLFWRMQYLPDVLRRWSATVPAHRVHVVTVPHRGATPEALWQRFAALLGVDAGCLDASPAAPNSSLTAVEAQLLRRLNMSLPPELPWWLYERTVRRQFIDVLARRPSQARLGVPAEQMPWVDEQAKALVTELADAGYHVVGDLDDLLPAEPAPSPDPDAVSDTELLDLALDAAREIMERYGAAVTEHERRHRSLRQRVRDLSDRNPALARALSLYHSLRHP